MENNKSHQEPQYIDISISSFDLEPKYDLCSEVRMIHGSIFSFKGGMEFCVEGDVIQARIPKGTSILELVEALDIRSPHSILAARIDNAIFELDCIIESTCTIEFIRNTEEEGVRIYRRSLLFMLIKAVNDLFPKRKVHICHSISKGLYCEITESTESSAITSSPATPAQPAQPASPASPAQHASPSPPPSPPSPSFKLTPRETELIEKRMHEIHKMNLRFKEYLNCRYFQSGLYNCFYGRMAPHTGYISLFSLKYSKPGLILLFPEKDNPGAIPEFTEQKKLFAIFKEYKKWTKIINAEDVAAINNAIENNSIGDVIRISEALHEKKLAYMADIITHDNDTKRIILISGPSSSGKTTFAERLSIQLRVNGVVPATIALDDYFLDRDKTPLDENGNHDYECLNAVDVALFNKHLNMLMNGQEAEIPVYDFVTGTRSPEGRKLRISREQVLLIEGIHGLNEKLTPTIPADKKFKVYVSALTSMNIDDHNRVQSTDTRVLRRMVRDNMRRGTNAVSTLRRWPSVRRGEDRYIFPYQEDADIMFNSSLIYELGVLKKFAEPLLAGIGRDMREYGEAQRLLELIAHFKAVLPDEVPLNSILREFIGGSCFHD